MNLFIIKMKTQKYHTVGKLLNPIAKSMKGAKSILIAHTHMHSHSANLIQALQLKVVGLNLLYSYKYH